MTTLNSQLQIYNSTAELQSEVSELADIQSTLQGIGVIYERWSANAPLADDADQDAVLAAYQADIDTLNARFGFNSIDVVSLQANNPKKDEMRKMFLSEHTHDDFEVRFFVGGQGLFFLRPQTTAEDSIYAVLCTAGDLISVPAGMTHWFDMGNKPSFKAIRFFTTDQGWVGNFTGDNIAERFPRLEMP